MTVAENWLEYDDIKPGQLKSVVQAAFCSGTTAVSPILWPPGHG